MPVTGKISQENLAQDECEEQTLCMDSIHIHAGSPQTQILDNSSAEVSSTTVDSDPIAETSVIPVLCVGASEPVQSASTVEVSDSVEVVKNQTGSFHEPVSEPSSSTQVGVGNGFQDAFAAFASSSFTHLEEEASPVEVSSDVSDSTVALAASADSSDFSVEPLVSSAIDSSQVTTTGESLVTYDADAVNVQTLTTESAEDETEHHSMISSEHGTESQSVLETEQSQAAELSPQAQLGYSNQTDASATGDSVYFIQMTDATGQLVTSIIDPNDIPSYADSVVYKQCMKPDGEIETTIVHSGGTTVTQEEQTQEQGAVNMEETDTQQGEQQIIYAHDLSGQLTPIDPIQSANDVAPPGKQFVYMQDSTGRIIRTVMDASQNMVPGQQVYYTQSEDGQIITSVMDSAVAGISEENNQEQQSLQQQVDEIDATQQQHQEASSFVDMSGLSMLAELSHLTAGQGLSAEQGTASSTDSSNSMDLDEFRPVAMVTRLVTPDGGLESVSSDNAELKVGETDSDSFDQCSRFQGEGTAPEESLITKIVSQMKGDQAQPAYTVSRDNLFVQWQNLDAMCWMDVILIMLVYSPTLRPLVNLDPNHELASTLLITLLKANRQAQVLLQNLLKKSNGAVISEPQTGVCSPASIQDPKTSKLVCKENMDEIGKAINILYAMREKIWQALQPRLRCERGKHNSPVLVLPLLVREKPAIKQMFTMNYRYVFKCEKCSYSQDDSHSKILPSIPTVPEDFNMKTPCFVRNCFECQAPNQRMLMKFERLQDFVQMHFVNGLPHNRFEELSFDFNDDHYEVTAVVHYKNNPDHFIAWVRNAPGSTWMECDDLKSVITRYLHVSPNIPPGQVHMVMWERRLTPQHTLVVRDTEDTKLLASLVLTVQQPNTHQSTEPETRSAGPLGASSSAATTQASSSTTLLSGLMNQTFVPFSRGRGRGRGRGSYGIRGRAAATTTPIIRRVTPVVTQASSPSHTSPQIVRLPLSALASSGLNLRGSSSAGARYVLVGNSSQAGTAGTTLTRAGTPSKVVVVRSQGGTANISAAQLLQLLQRTGAISQVGSQITATLTTSGASTAAPSAGSISYVTQQASNITATETSNSTAQHTDSLMETESLVTEQNIAEQTSSADQSISTLPFYGIADSTTGQTSNSNTIMYAAQPETSAALISQGESAASTSVNEEVIGEQPSLSEQTVSNTQCQQPGRYIQVPNPAGGGMLLCQLGMRDGKIVLVPVDKNFQTRTSGTSLLRVSNTGASPKITVRAAGTTQQLSSVSSPGAVLAQIQKQLLQSQSTSTGVSTGSRFITLPGSSGSKRIQLITVPQTQANQSISKTVIMSPISSHQTDTGTASVNRLVSSGEATSGDGLPQSSDIVIREIKRSDADNIRTITTSLSDGSSGQLVSTPAVSLLKDVSARFATTSARTSLLASSTSEQQTSQESFRYILPGSNTTHILHTGNSGGQSGAFTALSSSGTIVGGQLTPASSTIGTSPMDQDLSLSDMDDNSHSARILSPKQRLGKELITSKYIPLGRSRGRARGAQRGGRGRGGRGRGRSQLWNTDAELIAPVAESGQKISTLADLRQIGAHVIEAGSEAIDGVPVVSIPDFSSERAGQTEIHSAAQSIISDISSDTVNQMVFSLSDAHSTLRDVGQDSLPVSESISVGQGPRVITQPIPSVSVNHGFEILTRGIQGSGITARQSSSPPKQARSLLTGNTITLQSASSLLASLSETTASSLVSSAPTTQTFGHSEIDTLIQAAQAAAKPSQSGSQMSLMDSVAEDFCRSGQTTIHLEDDNFSLNDSLANNDIAGNHQDVNSVKGNIDDRDERISAQLYSEKEKDDTLMNVDENQVSAAERYRMPVELFQPDEESPEKSVKLEDIVNRTRVGLSSRVFHDAESGPHICEVERSPQKQNVELHATKDPMRVNDIVKSESDKNVEDHPEVTNNPGKYDAPHESYFTPSADVEDIVNQTEIETSTKESDSNVFLNETSETFPEITLTSKKKVGRPRGRPRGSTNKQGVGRKSNSGFVPELAATASTSSDVAIVTSRSSPERETSGPENKSLQFSLSSDPDKLSTSKHVSIEDSVTDSLKVFNEIIEKPKKLLGEESIDTILDNHQEEMGQYISSPSKKVGRSRGRPRGSTSKRERILEPTETISTPSLQATSMSSVDTSAFLTEIIRASSPEQEPLQQSTSIEDSVTDLLIVSDEVADKTKALRDDDSIDHILESHEDEVRSYVSSPSKTVGRPRGRPKGSKGSRRKSNMTSVPEPVETISTPLLGETEMVALVTPSGLSPERKINVTCSPEKEPLQQLVSSDRAQLSKSESVSIEDSISDSVMIAAEVAGSSKELKTGNVVPEASHKDDIKPDKPVTPKIIGRPRGRPKGSTSKQGVGRKSGSTNIPEAVSISSSVVTSGSSPERNVTLTSSPKQESLQHSPSADNTKISTSASLVESDSEIADKTNTFNVEDPMEFVQDSYQEASVSSTGRKEDLDIDNLKEKVLKRHTVSPAFVRCKKKKANWDIDAVSDISTHPSSPFSYKVLTGKSLISHIRHPSLGPIQELFISPLTVTSHKPLKSRSPGLSLYATVIRRRPQLKQKSEADFLKEPVISPLIFKDGIDPSCTGGSVVASPDGMKVFTGVIVGHKRRRTDWSCPVAEEDEFVHITGQELKTVQRKYCKQLMTVMYMDAGDFTAAVDGCSDDDRSDDDPLEEAVGVGGEFDKKGTFDSEVDKVVELDKVISGVDIVSEEDDGACSSIQSEMINIGGRSRKRGSHSLQSSVSSHPAEHAEFSGNEICSPLQSPSHSMDTETSFINGIATITSPGHSSQSSSDAHFVQASSFTTTRRSGRIPIPSKKVLDALEDPSFPSPIKVRRVSSMSSDDKQAGYSSDDMQQKNSTKQPLSPSYR